MRQTWRVYLLNTVLLVAILLLAKFNLSALESDPQVSGSYNSPPFKKVVLKAAVRTFSIIPKLEQKTDGRTGSKIKKIKKI